MTYDDARISIPLRTCQQCGKQWYMHAQVCLECRGYFVHVHLKPVVHHIVNMRSDVNGIPMLAGD